MTGNHNESEKQPMPATLDETPTAVASAAREAFRRHLLDERKAIIHHFSVGGHEGYLMVGLYEDGQPGEVFIRVAKAGSTIAGLMDSFGIAVSLALQYGVPLKWRACHYSGNRKDRIMRRKVE